MKLNIATKQLHRRNYHTQLSKSNNNAFTYATTLTPKHLILMYHNHQYCHYVYHNPHTTPFIPRIKHERAKVLQVQYLWLPNTEIFNPINHCTANLKLHSIIISDTRHSPMLSNRSALNVKFPNTNNIFPPTPWLIQVVAGLSLQRPRFYPKASPCGICGRQSGIGKMFSSKYFGFLLLVSFHRSSTQSIHWTIMLYNLSNWQCH